MNNMNETSRLNVITILHRSIKLYKDNFRLFISLSFMSFVISVISLVPSYLKKNTSSATLIILYMTIQLLAFLIMVYYGTRVYIALNICVSERYKGNFCNVSYAYSRSSEKFWGYIGVNILLGLAVAIPFIGGVSAFYLIEDILIKWLIIAVCAIPVIYIGTIYSFAPLLAVLENVNSKFSISKSLVNGDFWRLVLITTLLFTIFSGPYYLYMYVFNDYKQLSETVKNIAVFINHVLQIFVSPIYVTVLVTAFYTLKQNKRI